MSNVSVMGSSIWNMGTTPSVSDFWGKSSSATSAFTPETCKGLQTQNAPIRPVIAHSSPATHTAGTSNQTAARPSLEPPLFQSASQHKISPEVISERRSINNPLFTPEQRMAHPFARAEFMMLTEPFLSENTFKDRQNKFAHNQRALAGGALNSYIENAIVSEQRRERQIFSEWKKWDESSPYIWRRNAAQGDKTTFESAAHFLTELGALADLHPPLDVNDLKRMMGMTKELAEAASGQNKATEETFYVTDAMSDEAVRLSQVIEKNYQDPHYKEIKQAMLEGRLDTPEALDRFMAERTEAIQNTARRHTDNDAIVNAVTDHVMQSFEQYTPLVANYHAYKDAGLSAENYIDTVGMFDQELAGNLKGKAPEASEASGQEGFANTALVKSIEEKIAELSIKAEPATAETVQNGKGKGKARYQPVPLSAWVGDLGRAIQQEQGERINTHFNEDVMKAVANTDVSRMVHSLVSNNPRINTAAFSEAIKAQLETKYGSSRQNTSKAFSQDYKQAHTLFNAWTRQSYLRRFSRLDDQELKTQYTKFERELQFAYNAYSSAKQDLEQTQPRPTGFSPYLQRALNNSALIDKISTILTKSPRLSSSDFSKRISAALREPSAAGTGSRSEAESRNDAYRSALAIFQSWNKEIYFKQLGNKTNDALRARYPDFMKRLSENAALYAAQDSTTATSQKAVAASAEPSLSPDIVEARNQAKNYRIFDNVRTSMMQKDSAQAINPDLIAAQALQNLSDMTPEDFDLARRIVQNWQGWHYGQSELNTFSTRYGAGHSIEKYFAELDGMAHIMQDGENIPLPAALLNLGQSSAQQSSVADDPKALGMQGLAPIEKDISYAVNLQNTLDNNLYRHVINTIQFDVLNDPVSAQRFLDTLRQTFLHGQGEAIQKLRDGDFTPEEADAIARSHVDMLSLYDTGVAGLLTHYQDWMKENPGKTGRDYARTLYDAGADITVVPENWPSLPGYKDVPNLFSGSIPQDSFVKALKKDLDRHNAAEAQAKAAAEAGKQASKARAKKGKAARPVQQASSSQTTPAEKPVLTQAQQERLAFERETARAMEDSVRTAFEDIVFTSKRLGFTYNDIYKLPAPTAKARPSGSVKKTARAAEKQPAGRAYAEDYENIVPLTDGQKIALLKSYIPETTRQFANDNKDLMNIFIGKLQKDHAKIAQDPQSYREAEVKKANQMLEKLHNNLPALKKMRFNTVNFLSLYDSYIQAKADPRLAMDMDSYMAAVKQENQRYSELDETYKTPVQLLPTDPRDMLSRISPDVHQFYLSENKVGISLDKEFKKLAEIDTNLDFSFEQKKKDITKDFAKDPVRQKINLMQKGQFLDQRGRTGYYNAYYDLPEQFGSGVDEKGKIGKRGSRTRKNNRIVLRKLHIPNQLLEMVQTLKDTQQKKFFIDRALLDTIEHLQNEFPGTLVREIATIFDESKLAFLMPNDAVSSYQSARNLMEQFGNTVIQRFQHVDKNDAVASAVEAFAYSTREFIAQKNFPAETVAHVEKDIADLKNVMQQFTKMKEYFPTLRLQDFLVYLKKIPDAAQQQRGLQITG